MKPSQIQLILRILALIEVCVMTISATPISSRNQRDDLNRRDEGMTGGEKTTGTCLQIAPDLPPCNFDSEATWRSRSGEKDDRSKDRTPLSIGEKKNLGEFNFYENDLGITVVYYLEGCLPARLPFDLPSCPIEELQTIRMNKVVPFQLSEAEDALIFPEIDIKQIEFSHRQSRAPYPVSTISTAPQTPEESEGKDGDHSPKTEPILDRFFHLNDQDLLHKTMLNSNMKARTGTANTKYVSMLGEFGSRSIIPEYTWDSVKYMGKSLPTISSQTMD